MSISERRVRYRHDPSLLVPHRGAANQSSLSAGDVPHRKRVRRPQSAQRLESSFGRSRRARSARTYATRYSMSTASHDDKSALYAVLRGETGACGDYSFCCPLPPSRHQRGGLLQADVTSILSILRVRLGVVRANTAVREKTRATKVNRYSEDYIAIAASSSRSAARSASSCFAGAAGGCVGTAGIESGASGRGATGIGGASNN